MLQPWKEGSPAGPCPPHRSVSVVEPRTCDLVSHDDAGLWQIYLAPFDGARPFPAPVPVMQLSGGSGINQPLTLEGAGATARNGGFAFLASLTGWPSAVVSVKASGNRIEFTDPWGSTGTILLSPNTRGDAKCAS